MAAYGTLVAWAKAMGHTEAADLLEETLDEEKSTDAKLTQLAEGGINQEAADSAHPQEGDDDNEEEEGGQSPARKMAGGRATGNGRGSATAQKSAKKSAKKGSSRGR
jgi:hypothetical protein